jgi:two-component system NtrC family sensor kinase
MNGSGTITLSTKSDKKNIRVAVTDSGRGLTADQIKKIFDPFYTTKQAGKGTGLGLSVSYSIVKSMGGSIEVQSMPGAGSEFTIVLPIHLKQGAENGDMRNGKDKQSKSDYIAD